MDEDNLLLENIIDTSYTGFEVKAQYSKYETIEKSSFLNLGIAFRTTDNLSSLSNIELNETTVFENDENSEITGSTTFNFFQGKYKNRISELFLFLHYYRFFNEKESVAFHLYPRVILTEFQKPLINFDIGLLIPIKDKKKSKSVVNIEVFYSFSDITGKRASNRKRLLDGGIVGLRFTLPFNINF